jgi:threonine dehydrogenase-like Zn-dependent dehydrogenase
VRERGVALALRTVASHLQDQAAIFLEPGACVLRGIKRAGHGISDQHSTFTTCLIIGAGSMGLLHVLMLKAWNPKARILVSDPIQERRAMARSLGADATLTPNSTDWHDSVREFSSDAGVDIVFDTVGGAKILTSALGATREGGTVVLFGHAPPGELAAFEINSVFKHERRIIATYSGGLEEQSEVLDLLESESLKPVPLVSHCLPFSEFDRAVELSRSHQAQKILLYPDHSDQPTRSDQHTRPNE